MVDAITKASHTTDLHLIIYIAAFGEAYNFHDVSQVELVLSRT